MLTRHHAEDITKLSDMVKGDIVEAWNNVHAPEEVNRCINV